jgi:hypothetical protein
MVSGITLRGEYSQKQSVIPVTEFAWFGQRVRQGHR